MIRSEIRADVKLRLRLPANGDPLISDGTVNECIRLALLDISAEHDWPWLTTSATVTFSTTTGLASRPTDCVKIRELVVNGRVARYAGLNEWVTAATCGQRVWTDQGASLALSPSPTTVPTATLYYVRLEPVLTSDTSAPLLPEAYHSFLVARASYHANVRRRNETDAALDSNEFASGLKRMETAMHVKTGPRRVLPAGGLRNWAWW